MAFWIFQLHGRCCASTAYATTTRQCSELSLRRRSGRESAFAGLDTMWKVVVIFVVDWTIRLSIAFALAQPPSTTGTCFPPSSWTGSSSPSTAATSSSLAWPSAPLVWQGLLVLGWRTPGIGARRRVSPSSRPSREKCTLTVQDFQVTILSGVKQDGRWSGSTILASPMLF